MVNRWPWERPPSCRSETWFLKGLESWWWSPLSSFLSFFIVPETLIWDFYMCTLVLHCELSQPSCLCYDVNEHTDETWIAQRRRGSSSTIIKKLAFWSSDQCLYKSYLPFSLLMLASEYSVFGIRCWIRIYHPTNASLLHVNLSTFFFCDVRG